jgi:hypothetical protein
MLINLFWLPLLLFLEKKIAAELSQYIIIGLDGINNLKPKSKIP